MTLWLTAREIAGLPGFEVSERHVRKRLLHQKVPHRKRPQIGGGVEWDCSALPAETRAALMIPAAAPAPVVAFVPPPAVPVRRDPLPAEVPEAPRRMQGDAAKLVADSRLLLVNRFNELKAVIGSTLAAKSLTLDLVTGAAEPALMEAARAASQRSRQTRIAERTLYRWVAEHEAGSWFALLPNAPAPRKAGQASDVVAVLERYHSTDPRFANLTSCAKAVVETLDRPFDTWTALYGRARRALDKADKVELIKARHGGSERAAKLPFKHRSVENMGPLHVWQIDGHTFKAKVRHPDHGGPFAPEVTMVMDGKTRMVVGWSVSLSENVIAVGDALRHAMASHGMPEIVYSDNGSGQTAKQLDCPITGIMRRLNVEHRTGRPGNPQGRGTIERSWQQTMIECARQFGSYQGKDVDGQRLRKVTAELAKEQRAVRRAAADGNTVVKLSQKVPSWKQFMDAVEAAIDRYNTTHRHRGLPKREDGLHLTPAEAWDLMLEPAMQRRMDPQTLRMLFMPCVLRVARRGEVKFLNQVYFSPELMQVDGETVRVHYAIRDSSWVAVHNLKGELICEARWGANTVDFFPKAVFDMAREKRVQGIVKRRQLQIDTAMRELTGTRDAAIDATVFLPAPDASTALVPVVPGSGLQPLGIAASHDTDAAQAAAPGRPVFETPSERYLWLLEHRDLWNDSDDGWLRDYVASEHYEDFREFYESRGLAWTDGEDAGGFEVGVR